MTATTSSARTGASPQPPRPFTNRVFDGPAGRILCVADIRGQHSLLNQLAADTNARAIIHTGDFGFFETASLERINDRTLRHLLLYSPLIPNDQRERLYPKDASPEALRNTVKSSPPHLSEFPLLLSGKLKLSVPVYTVWGACEDVSILEKFRIGEYDVENLHIIDEATSRTLEIGGIKLRLYGLGGAFVPHKLFDNGEGSATIAGGAGTMWTTALQIGELVDTAQRTFDQTETRLLVTHASPGREGLLAQLALVLKADLTVSAALHFRYASSWNEFSVQGDADAYRTKLVSGQTSFTKIWESVKTQVESVMDDNQKLLLEKALMVTNRVPPRVDSTSHQTEEPAWKNTWNWNLCDASFGHLVLDIREGRISAELKSQGFNYAYRRAPPAVAAGASTPAAVAKPLSSAPSPAPTGPPSATPAPARPPSQQGNPKLLTNGAPGSTPAPAFMKSPGPTNNLQLTTGNNPQANQAPNGVNGTVAPPAASPTSPGLEVARFTASPAPSAGRPDKKKRLSNAEWRKSKERATSEAEASAKDGNSKPASPAPGAVANLSGKHGKKGSKASGGVASPISAPSPVPTPGPDAAGKGRATPIDGPRDAKSPPPQSRAPSGPGIKRNPWTLYLSRLPVPVTEQEVKDCFNDAASSITLVKLPHSGPGYHRSQKPIAFVEFKDEESMRTALAKSSKKIKDQVISMVVADNRERGPQGSGDDLNPPTPGGDLQQPQAQQDGADTSPSSSQSNGGSGRGGASMAIRGRGRGRGGLFAQAQRGLVQNAQQGGPRGGGGRKGSADGGSAPVQSID